MTKQFNLKPPPVRSRFPNNGNELLELSKAEFWVCAGSKHGGKKLAEYVAWKHYDATGRSIPSLQNDIEPRKRRKVYCLFIFTVLPIEVYVRIYECVIF